MIAREKEAFSPVLAFDYDLIVDGRKLERPVNHALVRIHPPEGTMPPREDGRPWVIMDPRAGHGSGIGGFKSKSEVGVALRDGHPVYFIIFYPEPVPGQTLADVCAAEAAFLREIYARHPASPRPLITGNCQGGWATMGYITPAAAEIRKRSHPLRLQHYFFSYRNPLFSNVGTLAEAMGAAKSAGLNRQPRLRQKYKRIRPCRAAKSAWQRKSRYSKKSKQPKGRSPMADAVIVSTARTPIGKAYRGAFNMTHGAELGGHVVKQAVARAGVDPAEVESVIPGCALPERATGGNIARQAAIRAGLPVTVTGMTVNRFCSSGLQAIALAAQRIISGEASVLAAGGLECIRLVQDGKSDPIHDDWIVEHKPAIYMPMIDTADIVAERYKVSREAQDAYALESQRRTATAQQAKRFDDEIVPLPTTKKVVDKNTKAESFEPVTLMSDEGNRRDTTLEGLAATAGFRSGECPQWVKRVGPAVSACRLHPRLRTYRCKATNRRFGPCVDGSKLARRIFTSQAGRCSHVFGLT